MTGASCGCACLVGTLAWMAIAIALAAWGLRSLFQEHITQQLQAQLVMQLDHLSAAVDWEPGGKISIGPMAADARLEQPLSGLYWQIDELDPKGGQKRPAGGGRALAFAVGPIARCRRRRPITRNRAIACCSCATTRGRIAGRRARPLELPEENAPRLRLVVAATDVLYCRAAAPFQHVCCGLLWASWRSGWRLGWCCGLHYGPRPLTLLRRRLPPCVPARRHGLEGVSLQGFAAAGGQVQSCAG